MGKKVPMPRLGIERVIMSTRRRIPLWCKEEMYRHWILGEREAITEEELTEEVQERIEHSKQWHPSRGPLQGEPGRR
jgi:hypothetical protein